jgi:soluble P-type ATPase
MISIQRPGMESLDIHFVLIDFEGTLAMDGRVHPKAKDKVNLLSKRVTITILTKSNREKVEETLRKMRAEILYVTEGDSSQQKLNALQRLGAHQTVVIGNGLDDVRILEQAGLGMCVIGKEGASAEAMAKADLVVTHVLDALDFLLKPLRQRAILGR